jgi:uncharacterized protein (DUF3820 family)
MELRSHPLISLPKQFDLAAYLMWIDGKENQYPRGEVGVLKQVRQVNAHPRVHRCSSLD